MGQVKVALVVGLSSGAVNLPSMETELLDKSGGRRKRKQDKEPHNDAGEATQDQAPVREVTILSGVTLLGFRMPMVLYCWALG